MSMLATRRLTTISTALGTFLAGAAASAAGTAQPDAANYGEPIIVTGYRDPLLDGIRPLDQLGGRDISGYGVNSVSELLADLGRELGDAGDSGPLVLLNGRRVSSLAEVNDLPTESIRRIEVLPAPVALRFGGTANQKVLNFVLRSQFRSASAILGGGLATEGGGRNGDLTLSLNQVFGDNRLSITGKAYTGRRLLESQRDIVQPDGSIADEGRFRTLRPQQRLYSLKGSLARELAGPVKVSVTGGGTYETSHGLNGLAISDELAPDGLLVGRGLRQNVRNAGGFLDLSASADVGRWSMSATGGYGLRTTDTLTERQLDSSELASMLLSTDRLTDRAHSRSNNVGVTLDASGPLLKLPAGDLRVSLYTDLSRSSLVSRLRRADTIDTGERNRTDAGAWLSAEVPITKDNAAGLLTGLSASFKAGLRSVSDIGTLRSYSYGMSWAPARILRLNAAMKHDRQPPSLIQLASPVIETSGIRAFDYVRGESVELTAITGGNPELQADRRRTFTIGADLYPFGPGKLRFAADYRSVRVTNPIAALPAATAEIQEAFPDRFVRDAGGSLVGLDSRLVNFEREDAKQLHWGFAWRRGGSARSSGNGEDSDNGAAASGLALRMSFDHTYVLKDEVRLRSTLPVIDLLHGGAIGAYGGRPRHLLQWELGANTGGMGARLLGNWRSGTTVRAGADESGLLRFSPLMQHELRLYADLQDRLPSFGWARGSRLTLSIANLLDDKPRVRDADGNTPLIYQSDYLDPLGRTVRLGLRKSLF